MNAYTQDCFNSGVFVCKPNADTFQSLCHFASSVGSFDGGDQGLLNSFFSSWSSKSRIPFTYNVTPSASYSYLPAYKQFFEDIKVIHFIGKDKPWMMDRYTDGSVVFRDGGKEWRGMIEKWWGNYEGYYRAMSEALEIPRVIVSEPIERGRDVGTNQKSKSSQRKSKSPHHPSYYYQPPNIPRTKTDGVLKPGILKHHTTPHVLYDFHSAVGEGANSSDRSPSVVEVISSPDVDAFGTYRVIHLSHLIPKADWNEHELNTGIKKLKSIGSSSDLSDEEAEVDERSYLEEDGNGMRRRIRSGSLGSKETDEETWLGDDLSSPNGSSVNGFRSSFGSRGSNFCEDKEGGDFSVLHARISSVDWTGRGVGDKMQDYDVRDKILGILPGKASLYVDKLMDFGAAKAAESTDVELKEEAERHGRSKSFESFLNIPTRKLRLADDLAEEVDAKAGTGMLLLILIV